MSPVRVLDSTLRMPSAARILDDEAATIVYTTDRSSDGRRDELRGRGVGVRLVPAGATGINFGAVLIDLRSSGVLSLLGRRRRQGDHLGAATHVAGSRAVMLAGRFDLPFPRRTEWTDTLGVAHCGRNRRFDSALITDHPAVTSSTAGALASLPFDGNVSVLPQTINGA